MSRFILLFFFLVSFNSHALIHGKRAPIGFLSFVGIWPSGCTITKVGPRHFVTAAHCVVTDDSPEYIKVEKRDRELLVTFPNLVTRFQKRMKSTVFIHKTWLDFLKICSNCEGRDRPERDDFKKVDIALFVVKELTPNVPWIDISFNSLSADGTQEVYLAGYGNTGMVGFTRKFYAADNPNLNYYRPIKCPTHSPGSEYIARIRGKCYGNLRYNVNKVVQVNALSHDGSRYKTYEREVGESNWVTKAYGWSSKLPALAHGDSGGPLLKKDSSGSWQVVGLAHHYTFKPGVYYNRMPMTNLHTRLDDESFHGVGQWIRSRWDAI